MNDKILFFKNANLNAAPKSISQYLEIKKDYENDIVFFRIGDFYETFFEDAHFMHKNCNLTLTERKYNDFGIIDMAGIPSIALYDYVKKLLDINKKIVVIEQFKEENGEISRHVDRIFTKGTAFENELLEAEKNNYLCAVYEKNGAFGFSYCDSSVGTFRATSGTKEEIAREFSKISPNEIIANSADTIEKFKEVIENTKNITIFPELFNDNKNEAKTASGAILEYLKLNQNKYMPKLYEVELYSVNEFLAMDFQTRKNLEFTRASIDFKKRGTLFWFLDNTKTTMGKRALKSLMAAPLRDIETIKKRQFAISKIFENKNLKVEIEEFLDNFCDILRLSGRISNKTVGAKEILELSNSINKIENINKIAKELGCAQIEIENESEENLKEFSKLIKRSINFDENFIKYPIKTGANSTIDFLRYEFENYEAKLKEIEKTLPDGANIKYSPNIGYFFEISNANSSKIKDSYITKQKTKSGFRLATAEILDLEEKICALKFSLEQNEIEVFEKIKTQASKLTFKVRDFANKIAYLDAIFSLFKVAEKYNFTCPNFNKEGKMEIKEGAHPVGISLIENFRANDTNLSSNPSFALLTGANMSGKSTYLKQNALIVILAQIGSFVPAKYANLPILDKIFFQSSSTDSITNGTSTFFEEMKGISRILDFATKDSLILLDEAIKGTNPNDASALTTSIFEYIIDKNIKTLASTHYINCAKALEGKTGFCPLSIGEKVKNKIEKGISNNKNAFETALLAGLSPKIVERAREISK